MNRKRALEVVATSVLLLTLVAVGGGFLYFHQINQALIRATWDADATKVRMLLKQGANPNLRDHRKLSLLMYATVRPSGATAKALLEGGANPNVLDNIYPPPRPPLAAAAARDYLDLVQILLRHGANVNLPAADGSTPLMVAAGRGNHRIVSELLRAGADRSARNAAGESALDCTRKAMSGFWRFPVRADSAQARRRRYEAVLHLLKQAASRTTHATR